MSGTMFDALPTELTQRVCKSLSQEDRLAVMLTCKPAYAAVRHPCLWHSVHAGAPSPSLVDFLVGMGTRTLRLDCAEAVSQTARARMEQTRVAKKLRLQHLTVFLSVSDDMPVLTAETLSALPLRTLDMEFEVLSDDIVDLTMPAMRDLEILRIRERDPDHWLAVTMGAAMPRLRAVEFVCYSCNVLAHLPDYPDLRRVVYRNEYDTYNDANFVGCELDVLELDVHEDGDGTELSRRLTSAAHVDRLCLAGRGEEITLNDKLPVREYVIYVRDVAATLTVDRRVFEGADSMTVCVDPTLDVLDLDENFTVMLTRHASIDEWAPVLRRLDLCIPCSLSFEVGP